MRQKKYALMRQFAASKIEAEENQKKTVGSAGYELDP